MLETNGYISCILIFIWFEVLICCYLLFHENLDKYPIDCADSVAFASPHTSSKSFAVCCPDSSSHSYSFASALAVAIASSITDPDTHSELATDSSSFG